MVVENCKEKYNFKICEPRVYHTEQKMLRFVLIKIISLFGRLSKSFEQIRDSLDRISKSFEQIKDSFDRISKSFFMQRERAREREREIKFVHVYHVCVYPPLAPILT